MKGMSGEEMYKAVRDGVYGAIWQMITNATDDPCQDFYYTIGKAVEKAVDSAVGSVDLEAAFERAIAAKLDKPKDETDEG